MPRPNENGFADRRKAAEEAKKLLLKKFESAPKPDDPEMIAKRAEREALAAARETRRIEREREKQEQAAREKIEAAARAEAEAAAKAAREAEAKAERDRRYAARKARKR